MTLSIEARNCMSKRDNLSEVEVDFIDNCFAFMFENARMLSIPAGKDDRAASLEAAFIRFVIDSREGA